METRPLEGLGVDAIVSLLEAVVHSQRNVIEDVLGVKATNVPQMWCLVSYFLTFFAVLEMISVNDAVESREPSLIRINYTKIGDN